MNGPPLVRRTRKTSFTAVCYSFIGVLLENPQARFALTEQRIAERMVANGWLKECEIEVPKSIGVYNYTVNIKSFIPTEEGLTLYEELHSLIKPGVDLQQLEKAFDGETRKQKLKLKLKD